MDIINPATEELIATVQEDSVANIGKKYQEAKTAQQSWKSVPLKKRIAVLNRFGEHLKHDTSELGAILSSEMGKPLNQATGEIAGAGKRIKYFVQNSEHWLSDEVVNREEGLEERIAYEPLGVIANISAWNYPYLVGVNVFVPALIAGNSVLYKPSEYATLTGIEIQKLLNKAGVPQGVFQTVVGAQQQGQALLEIPLDGYFFTGSYKTGKHIYQTVAHKLVPCQLELGGKDPLYVTNDIADIQSDRKSTRLNSSHTDISRMPSSA